MADLSKISDKDLLAYKAGKYSDISDDGLLAIKAAMYQDKPSSGNKDKPSFASTLANTATENLRNVESGAMGLATGGTMGLGPRVATEVGTIVAKPILEGAELLSGGKYQAPSYQDLRKIGEKNYYGAIKKAQKQSPIAYGLGEAAGLIGGGGTLAKIGGKALAMSPKAQAALTAAGKTRAGMFLSGQGATAGALSKATSTGLKLGGTAAAEGAIYGFGQEQDLSKAGENAVKTAGLSGLVAGGLGAGGSLIKSTVAPIIPVVGEKIAKATSRIRQAGDEVSKRIYGAVSQVLSPDELSAAIDTARKSREPLAISMQDELAGFSRNAANTPNARDFVSGYFAEKKKLVSDKLEKVISKNIYNPINTKTFIDDIIKNGREKARPLYEKAYSVPIEINKNIDNILKTDVAKNALAKGIELEQIDAAAQFRDPIEFNVVDNKVPTQAMDMVIRGIDELAFAETTDFGVKSTKAKKLKELRKTLLGLVTEQNPILADARKVSSDYIAAKEAFDAGQEFLNMGGDALKSIYKDMTPANKKIMLAAIADKIRVTNILRLSKGINDVQGMSDVINDKNLILGKLKTILPEKNYNAFKNALNDEVSMIRLSNSLLSGSQTQLNAVSKKWAESGGQDLANTIADKGVAAVTQEKIADIIRLYSSKMPENMTNKIAEVIFSQDPKVQKNFLLNLKMHANADVRRDAIKAFIELRAATMGKYFDKGIEAAAKGVVVPMAEGN